MCGIVGYLGAQQAAPIILKGLQRLEYRGYDSSGIVLYDNADFELHKTQGKVSDLSSLTNFNATSQTIGLGHTRWATHGVPSDTNAHPHYSNSGELALIHNGIIENYESIKKVLLSKGYHFVSDTDTEVLVNLIEDVQKMHHCKLGKAVQIALTQVVGTFAIAVIDKKRQNEMVVAKLGSPLAIGISEDGFFVASDASPFIEYTNRAIYLEDHQMAILIKGQEPRIRWVKDDAVSEYDIHELELSLEQIEKGGYDHFMLKEIFEQPKAIADAFRGRLLPGVEMIKMEGVQNHLSEFLKAKRIIIVACGTSWHAGLVAEYILEEFTHLPVEVEYASEFRYRNPVIKATDVVIAISQSGETADTLAAIKLAKEQRALVYGVCNVVGSSIARETHAGAYTHAGPEIGVASTKAFTTQITILTLVAMHLANEKGTLSSAEFNNLVHELEHIPEKIQQVLLASEGIKKIAEEYAHATNCLFLGRGVNFPVALEGALKLKEISYIHAEGYPAAEMKHGPIALIDENMPVIVIAINKGHYDKTVSNIQEIKSRHGKIIAIVTEGDQIVKELADHVIEIPETLEWLTPLLTTIPLQLLSYHMAVLLGKNVDQPRNLAKSVTVE